MKEFGFVIDKAIYKGLSPEVDMPTNAEYLSECIGGKCDKTGFIQTDEFDILPAVCGSSGIYPTIGHPFPQLFVGTKDTILVYSNKIMLANDTQIEKTTELVVMIYGTNVLQMSSTTFADTLSIGDKITIYGSSNNNNVFTVINISGLYIYVSEPIVSEVGTITIIKHWQFDDVMIKDIDNPANIATFSVVDNEPFHFVDFGDSWFLFNGTYTIFKTAFGNLPGREEYSGIFLESNMTIRTGCAFKGRLITAGFNKNTFWNSDWQEFWDFWKDSISDDFPDLSGLDMLDIDDNFVMWSPIGNTALMYFFVAYLGLSPITEPNNEIQFEQPAIFEMFKQNQLGFMPMPWDGGILNVKKLGDKIIVYGDNGVAVLFPVSSPFPTFGMKKILDFGIRDALAVIGTDYGHTFITSNGELWIINNDLQVKRLGYSNILGGYVKSDKVMMSMDTLKGDIYILFILSGDCYILSKTEALSQIYLSPNSIITRDGDTIGVVSPLSSSAVSLVTEQLDMKSPGIKSIQMIHVDGSTDVGTFTVGVLSKYQQTRSYSTPSQFSCNYEGVAYPIVTGTKFKIKVSSADLKNATIKSITCNWKQNDKRYKRGLNAY